MTQNASSVNLPRGFGRGVCQRTYDKRARPPQGHHPGRVFLKESYDDDEPLWQKLGSFVGFGSQDDPGHWNNSPEWFGQQGGGWGRNIGNVVFERMSPMNGLVQVTSHPASLLGSEKYAEWRVLRFNGITRQSVTRLHDREGVICMDATCLAAEYLKTVASLVSSWMGFRRGDDESVEMLAIGIGGGSMPMFLRHYFPLMTIDAVEIDPVVIEAAQSCMGFPRCDERLCVFVEDAAVFVQEQQLKKQYDFIYIDAFDGEDCIPEDLCGEEFIQGIDSMLHPENGVLVMNFHENDPRAHATAHQFHRIIQGTSFTISCRVQRNFILCCSKSTDLADLTSDDLKRMIKSSASFVSQKLGVPFSMGERATADFSLLSIPKNT